MKKFWLILKEFLYLKRFEISEFLRQYGSVIVGIIALLISVTLALSVFLLLLYGLGYAVCYFFPSYYKTISIHSSAQNSYSIDEINFVGASIFAAIIAICMIIYILYKIAYWIIDNWIEAVNNVNAGIQNQPKEKLTSMECIGPKTPKKCRPSKYATPEEIVEAEYGNRRKTIRRKKK